MRLFPLAVLCDSGAWPDPFVHVNELPGWIQVVGIVAAILGLLAVGVLLLLGAGGEGDSAARLTTP